MIRSTWKLRARRGMTLMEVVIAIGVIAFVIPLILGATGSSGNSRRNAEADTRSVWLAREAQRQVLSKWAEPARESVIADSIAFPEFSSAASPLVLAFDAQGEFIAGGGPQDLSAPSKIPKAAYLVAVHGETYTPPGGAGAAGLFSQLHIRVLSPAKATPATRSTYRYNLITTRQGTL